METKQKNKTKTLKVFGYEINSNSCSALEYSLYVKKFKEFVVRTGHENHGLRLTMNHIKIHELLNEAISVEVVKEDETEDVYLHIETEEFKVSFKIPEVHEEVK